MNFGRQFCLGRKYFFNMVLKIKLCKRNDRKNSDNIQTHKVIFLWLMIFTEIFCSASRSDEKTFSITLRWQG